MKTLKAMQFASWLKDFTFLHRQLYECRDLAQYKNLCFFSTTSLHLHHSKPAPINDSWTADKAAWSGSMSEMVCWTNSRVMRNHSFRVADLGQSSRPSRIDPPGIPSRITAITSQLLLKKVQPKVRPFQPQSEELTSSKPI